MPLPPSLSLRVGAPGQGRLVLAALNHCAQPPRGEACFPLINALFVLPEIARGPRSPLLISSLEIAAHIRTQGCASPRRGSCLPSPSA